jgi:hypothetical protein
MTTFKRIVRFVLQTVGSQMCSKRLPVLNLEHPTQD